MNEKREGKMNDILKTTVTPRGFTHFEEPVRDKVGGRLHL